MLINLKTSENVDKKKEIKFISYSGKYPNLCSGALHISVDGEDFFFGYSFNFTKKELEGIKKIHEPFWSSGGTCGFDSKWDSHVTRGDWEIDKDSLPEELVPYAEEIDNMFNSNVPSGCCGGCL